MAGMISISEYKWKLSGLGGGMCSTEEENRHSELG